MRHKKHINARVQGGSAHRESQRESDGFTIVELMIATAVLSTILVLVTIVMISIGNLYYKGVNQSRVQGDVRSITDELAQHLKLSEGYIPGDTSSGGGFTFQAFCIGDTRYSYILGVQIGNELGQINHALWRDTNTSGTCKALNLTQPTPSELGSSNGAELVSPHSRLTELSLTGNSPYTISIGVAFGDTDLLTGTTGLNVACRGDTGDQFCATASLTTTVVQRLTGNQD